MENGTLFIAYLVSWVPYLVGVHAYALRRHFSQWVVVVSHSVPTLVALVMAYIFLLGGGASVRQYVAGSDRGIDLWSLWVDLWPVLLFATLSAGVFHLIAVFVIGIKRERHVWIPVMISGAIMCAFAFMAVAANFPDA